MIFIDRIQKLLPLIIAGSVVVAFVYLQGFFYQTNSSLIYYLSYSDILISIAYMIPILSLVIFVIQIGLRNAERFYLFETTWLNILWGIAWIVIITIVLWFIGEVILIGYVAILAIIISKPVRLFIADTFQFAPDITAKFYMALVVLGIAYAQGYSDFSNAAYGNLTFNIVESKTYKNCRLIKIFSEVVLLGNGKAGQLIVIPNNNELFIESILELPNVKKRIITCSKKYS